MDNLRVEIPFTRERSRTILLWILASAFILRLATIFPAHAGGFGSDEKEYLFLAHQIASGNGFVDSNGEYSVRAPLFPAILSLCVLATGSALVLPYLLVVLFGTLTVYATWVLAREIWRDERTALLAAALVAFFPSLVLHGSLIMTEGLAVSMLLLALVLAIRLESGDGYADHIAFGILCALAVLTRAVFFGLVPLLFLGVAVRRFRAGKKSGRVLVGLAVWCIVLAPWTIRNYGIHHAFVPVSSGAGLSLLSGNNPYSHGTLKLDQGFQEWFDLKLYERGLPPRDSLSEVRASEAAQSIALGYIAENPAHTLSLALRKAFVLWVYPLSNRPDSHALQAFLMAFDIVLLVCTIVGGAVVALRRIRLYPMWLVAGFCTLTHMVLHSEARFRLPVLPLLCVVAAGIMQVRDPSVRVQLLGEKKTRMILLCGVLGVTILYGYAAALALTGGD